MDQSPVEAPEAAPTLVRREGDSWCGDALHGGLSTPDRRGDRAA
jgi:hypothetical protein